jgi:putative flippase GtrA
MARHCPVVRCRIRLYCASLGLLYLIKGVFRVPLAAATPMTAEIATIPRFFVTDVWVFDRTTSTAKGLWQFHWANAGGFVIWWCTLPSIADPRGTLKTGQ